MPRTERGFTLIEVAIAVTLVGFALTTLITMQTGFADTYIRERSLTKAGLYSQYLLTLAELAKKPPEEGTTDNNLEDALRSAGYFDGLDDLSTREEFERLKGWMVHTQVTKIPIADNQDALRRLEMTVTWSDAPSDQLQITYYLKSK